MDLVVKHIRAFVVAAVSDGFAIKSESYAHGGTNSRAGESTDNGLYYKEQAHASAQAASIQAQAAAASATSATASQTTATQKAAQAGTSAATASTKATESANSAVLSQSYAIGGTNTRTGENTDNSRYYSQRSESASEISKEYLQKVEQAGNEAVNKLKDALDVDAPDFQMNLSTGHLMYEGGRFVFHINNFGHLEWGLAI